MKFEDPLCLPIDHLQVLLEVLFEFRSIVALACVTKLTQSLPPSASLRSHDLGLQVNLAVHWISASKFISILARLLPPSASVSTCGEKGMVDIRCSSAGHTGQKGERAYPHS